MFEISIYIQLSVAGVMSNNKLGLQCENWHCFLSKCEAKIMGLGVVIGQLC